MWNNFFNLTLKAVQLTVKKKTLNYLENKTHKANIIKFRIINISEEYYFKRILISEELYSSLKSIFFEYRENQRKWHWMLLNPGYVVAFMEVHRSCTAFIS